MAHLLSGAPLVSIPSIALFLVVVISAMNVTAVGPFSFLIGFASIHLVNLSTATSRCVMPPRAVLNGPTMSSPQTAKGQARGMVLSAEADRCCWELNF